jgi:hypothetical protein
MAQTKRDLKLFNLIAGGIQVPADPMKGDVKVAAHDGHYHEFSARCYPVLANIPSAIREVQIELDKLETAYQRERDAQVKLRGELDGIIGHQWVMKQPELGERPEYVCSGCNVVTDEPANIVPRCEGSTFNLLLKESSRLGPELRALAELCQNDLNDNKGKGGWKSCSFDHLIGRIAKHAHELIGLEEEILRPVAGKPLPGHVVEQLRAPFIDVIVHLVNYTMMFHDLLMKRGGGPEAFVPSVEPEMLKRFEGGYDVRKHFYEVSKEIDEALGVDEDDNKS